MYYKAKDIFFGIIGMLTACLFFLGYYITLWMYPNGFHDKADADAATDLRYNFYAIIVASVTAVALPYIPKNFPRFALCFISGLCVSDLVDRFIWNIYDFTDFDKYITIPLSLLIAVLEYRYYSVPRVDK